MNFGDPRLPLAFWIRCFPEPNSGCWIMLGREVAGGYTQIWNGSGQTVTHRVAYEAVFGPLPPFDPTREESDIELDHRCRTPGCANPDHLRVLSHLENTLIGTGVAATNAKKTACPKNHPLSPENTIISMVNERPSRSCRTCAKQRKKASRARLRARAGAAP